MDGSIFPTLPAALGEVSVFHGWGLRAVVVSSCVVLLQMTGAALFRFIAADKTRNKNARVSQLEVTGSACVLSHVDKIFLLHMVLCQMRLVALKMAPSHVPEETSPAFVVN